MSLGLDALRMSLLGAMIPLDIGLLVHPTFVVVQVLVQAKCGSIAHLERGKESKYAHLSAGKSRSETCKISGSTENLQLHWRQVRRRTFPTRRSGF